MMRRWRTRLKEAHPHLMIGMVGPHVTVSPEESLAASPGLDFVAIGEFDDTVVEVSEGRSLDKVKGIVFRSNGSIHRTPPRPLIAGPRSPSLCDSRLRQGPARGELFHRLSEAPLCLILRGARMPGPLHLLSVAADHRRRHVPGTEPGQYLRGALGAQRRSFPR